MANVSFVVLLLLIILSIWGRVNVGWLAILSAIALNFWAKGESSSKVLGLFPSDLFLTLLSLSYFFCIVQANGTLEKIFHSVQALVRCGKRTLPWLYFFLAAVLASLGAGNIAAAGLIAPMAMLSCQKYGISPLVMIIMVSNGSNAGGLSPLSPAGLVWKMKLEQLGLIAEPIKFYLFGLLAHFLISLLGYFILRAYRADASIEIGAARENWNGEQKFTVALLIFLVAGTVLGGISIMPLALLGAVLLIIFFPRDEKELLRLVPWKVLFMISGFSLYLRVVEGLGGIEIVSSWLLHNIPAKWMPGSLALLSGGLSTFSSSTAVVLPTFLPMIPSLLPAAIDSEPFRYAASIGIGAHLVDASPLSTVGALCLTAYPVVEKRERLFQQALFWGLAMIPTSSIVCQILFGL